MVARGDVVYMPGGKTATETPVQAQTPTVPPAPAAAAVAHGHPRLRQLVEGMLAQGCF